MKTKTSRLDEVYATPTKKSLTLGAPSSYLTSMEKASLAEQTLSPRKNTSRPSTLNNIGSEESDKSKGDDSEPEREGSLEVGSRVEARYKGRSKYYPGKITRVRLDGTYDIDYDYGEKESRVREDLIRAVGKRSPSPSSKRLAKGDDSEPEREGSLEVGSRVEARYKGRSKYYPGKISRVRLDGTYDIDYDDGEKEQRVALELIRTSDRRPLRFRRDVDADDSADSGAAFSRGSRVACYWYRQSTFGAPGYFPSPKPAIILSFNADGTYSVEIEGTRTRIEDVPEKYIKEWTSSTHAESHKGITGESSYDYLSAVEVMAEEYSRLGKGVSSLKSVRKSDIGTFTDAKMLKLLLGEDVLREFREAFDRFEEDGEIDDKSMLKAFKLLGGEADSEELKAYSLQRYGRKVKKYYDFESFVIAYANLFYTKTKTSKASVNEDAAVGKALRLEKDWTDLASFARKFGRKQLSQLESAFDHFAVKGTTGELVLPASSILDAFHKVGRAITVTKLRDWMSDADVSPKDGICLADFVSVYNFFFGEAADPSNDRMSTRQIHDSPLTISEVALVVLQEEPWNGSRIQHDNLIKRLSFGRSSSLVAMIAKARDAFEELDSSSRGAIQFSDIQKLLRKLNISPISSEYSIRICSKNAKKTNSDNLSLPEVFVHFGSLLTETAEDAIGVAEAFAMFRLNLSMSEIRTAADFVCRIIDNILQNKDPKFWQVNINSEVNVHNRSLHELSHCRSLLRRFGGTRRARLSCGL